MYEIKAKLIADRINISRGGARARRLPSIVLATGAVLRVAPGRSVRVTEQVYDANKELLNSFEGMIDVIDHRDVTPPAPIPPEPVLPVEDKTDDEPPAADPPKPKRARSRSRKKKAEDA